MHNQFKTQKFEHLMLTMGPRDLNSAPYSPVHCGGHSMTSFQSSELTELLVVENSQIFARRAHSARYAPIGNWRFAFNGGAIPALCFLPWQWVANCCVWGPAKIDSCSPQMHFQPFVVRFAHAASSEEET